MLQFENQYRSTDGQTDLDAEFLNKVFRSVDARIHKIELIEREWLAEARKLVELGQARIDLVLQPAVDSISRQVELGFLQATVNSSVTFQTGVVNVVLVEGDDRQFFRPSPFVVLTRESNADDYAVGRVTAPYDNVSGELQIDVIDFSSATAGPFLDCIVSVTSGAALAAIQIGAGIQQAKADAIQAKADAVEAAGVAVAAGGLASDSATDALQSKNSAVSAAGDAVTAAAIVSNLSTQILALDAISAEIASVAAGVTDIATVAANLTAILDAAALVNGLTATTSEIRSGASGKIVDASGLFAASEFVNLAYSPTISVDLNAGLNFSATLTGSPTIANPTNAKAGQSGVIEIIQDATGFRVPTFGSAFVFQGGTPAFSTAANAVDLVPYVVRSVSPLTLRCSFSGA